MITKHIYSSLFVKLAGGMYHQAHQNELLTRMFICPDIALSPLSDSIAVACKPTWWHGRYEIARYVPRVSL
jgi:hypothetical protein